MAAAQHGGAVVDGVVRSPDGARLPGAEIVLTSLHTGAEVVRALADDDGAYTLSAVPAGRYRMEVKLPGFQTASQEIVLQDGDRRTLDVEMALATLEGSVEVVADRTSEIQETGTSKETLAGELVDIAPVQGDDYQSLLPLLPGVVRGTDGRIVMKGGTATQSGLIVNSGSDATDPATGEPGFNLPADAIQSVEVLPNPYAAEFGRFSTGVTNILTRAGTNRWKFSINNFFPRPKFRDGAILGIGGFTPRLSVRGPLVKDRLFVSQTLQYRYLQTRVPGQPDLQNDTRLESFESFTQLDAVLSDRHNLTLIFSVFPRKLDFVGLDTFNPKPVTPNFHTRGINAGLSDRYAFSPTLVAESTLSWTRLEADIYGQGLDAMRLGVEANSGSFFNIQRRKTRTLQWAESLSKHYEGWGGEHLFEVGFDVLHSSLDGFSDSRPVEVLRADGTLSRRIRYSGASSQRGRATDLALYAQDRWRIDDRLIFELGARVDRDGVLDRSNVSPRFGFSLGVLPDGKGILRGGAGLFHDRTALNVGAFQDYERPTVTRFAADGTTPAGNPVPFDPLSGPDLRTPYSFTWNIEYDHRVSNKLLLKSNFLRRTGQHEFIVDPLESGGAGTLLLDSRGRSRYWEWEFTGRYDFNDQTYLILSYVRSEANRDLNVYDDYFGNFRNPIIQANQFGRADTDAPHRFIARGTIELPGGWLFSPVVELRSGFPWGTIDENRDFVSPRNGFDRYPRLLTLDVDIQRWVKIWKWRMRVGIRIFNTLGNFNPRNVQNNLDSALFGAFSNEIPRKYGATLQIEP